MSHTSDSNEHTNNSHIDIDDQQLTVMPPRRSRRLSQRLQGIKREWQATDTCLDIRTETISVKRVRSTRCSLRLAAQRLQTKKETSSDSKDDNNNGDSKTSLDREQVPMADWIIPEGIRGIIEQLAVEEVFQQLVLEHSLVTARAKAHKMEMWRLIVKYPGICQRKYEVHPHGTRQAHYLYPLSIVCFLQPSLQLLQCIYQAFPEAIEHVNPENDSLALHVACGHRASVDVVAFLVDKFPTSVEYTRYDQMIPLIVAFRKECGDDVICYLANHMTDKAIALFRQEFSFALHVATHDQNSLALVQSFYQLDPEAILRTGPSGATPLQLACMNNGNADVVKFLLEKGPEALAMQDDHDMTCLLLAVRNQCLPVVQMLLPDDLPPQVDNVLSILDIALMHNAADVVDYIIQRFPQLTQIEVEGVTPLHLAIGFDSPFDNVRVLVEHSPHLLLKKANRYGLPIKLAKKMANMSKSELKYLEKKTSAMRKEENARLRALRALRRST